MLGVERFADVADYLTVNISSPNTPGLRNLQSARGADPAARRRAEGPRPRRRPGCRCSSSSHPISTKPQLDEIAAAIAATDLDGLIVSNTTISRDAVAGMENATETGGLSGKPLFNLSTRRLAQMRQRVGALPIIGVGGIHSPESALAKFEAGANAIQLYSALVFGGLDLLDRIKRGLAAAVRAKGVTNISAIVGGRTAQWAAGRIAL